MISIMIGLALCYRIEVNLRHGDNYLRLARHELAKRASGVNPRFPLRPVRSLFRVAKPDSPKIKPLDPAPL